jgi:hypothetical protein
VTRLLVDDPDELDLRRQREMDRAEARRLEVELAERGATPATPAASRAMVHRGISPNHCSFRREPP